jgi:dihydroorotase
MRPLALTNARIVDPASGRDAIGTLVVRDRLIESVDGGVPPDAERIDARGRVLAPGLIDAMAFRTDKAACLAGGITRLLLMPDQSPPLDDPALIERAERLGKPDVWVHPLAAATRGLEGAELAEIGLMKLVGAAGVSNGRRWIASAGVMHRLMQYAAGFDLVVVSHCEDASLTAGSVATAGEIATRMGLSAAPAFAEALAVARDLRLAEATGVRLHVAQVTTAESVELVRSAKRRGVRVSCGVTPAHMLLSEGALTGYRTFARLSPPLRTEDDRRAVLDGLADGTIDLIASGHDPRTDEDKRLPFADAEPGMVGAETLLPLSLSLVRDGRLTLARLLALLSTHPARLFGLPGGGLRAGEPADLVLFDEGAPWRIDADRMAASAGNTPFDGLPVQGRIELTIKGGELLRG